LNLLSFFRRKPEPKTEPMARVITMRVIITLEHPAPRSSLEPYRDALVEAVQQAVKEVKTTDPRLDSRLIGTLNALLAVGSSVRES
jgi:hypothetical protein